MFKLVKVCHLTIIAVPAGILYPLITKSGGAILCTPTAGGVYLKTSFSTCHKMTKTSHKILLSKKFNT